VGLSPRVFWQGVFCNCFGVRPRALVGCTFFVTGRFLGCQKPPPPEVFFGPKGKTVGCLWGPPSTPWCTKDFFWVLPTCSGGFSLVYFFFFLYPPGGSHLLANSSVAPTQTAFGVLSPLPPTNAWCFEGSVGRPHAVCHKKPDFPPPRVWSFLQFFQADSFPKKKSKSFFFFWCFWWPGTVLVCFALKHSHCFPVVQFVFFFFSPFFPGAPPIFFFLGNVGFPLILCFKVFCIRPVPRSRIPRPGSPGPPTLCRFFFFFPNLCFEGKSWFFVPEAFYFLPRPWCSKFQGGFPFPLFWFPGFAHFFFFDMRLLFFRLSVGVHKPTRKHTVFPVVKKKNAGGLGVLDRGSFSSLGGLGFCKDPPNTRLSPPHSPRPQQFC